MTINTFIQSWLFCIKFIDILLFKKWVRLPGLTKSSKKFYNILVCACLQRVHHMTKAVQAAQLNVQHSLIWELILYKFKPGHNTAAENNCWAKGEDAVDHSIKSRWFRKFCSSYKKKNLGDQVSSDSWSLVCHCLVGFITFVNLAKELQNCVSSCQNTAKLLTHPIKTNITYLTVHSQQKDHDKK